MVLSVSAPSSLFKLSSSATLETMLIIIVIFFVLSGVKDLKSGLIVTPLPPKATFMDDPLRVLRAIRFGTCRHFLLFCLFFYKCLVHSIFIPIEL